MVLTRSRTNPRQTHSNQHWKLDKDFDSSSPATNTMISSTVMTTSQTAASSITKRFPLKRKPVQLVKPLQTEDNYGINGEEETLHGERESLDGEEESATSYKPEVVWFPNVVLFVLLHVLCIYGVYIATYRAYWYSWVFAIVWGVLSGLGITAGAHRLWSHKSYKAKLPLRIMLMIFNCMACQNDIYEWCRDHRVHHKFSETHADPHNVNRGFFFAHVGWLMCRKHPDVLRKGASVDCSDLLEDPVIRFQRKHYMKMTLTLCFGLTTLIPYLYGEEFAIAFLSTTVARYVISLNFTWLVNSAAHLYGNKPYDKNISPAENKLVAFAAIGEGFHNYHHTFPFDYRTSEFGMKLNFTTMFINAMAVIGWAYDLKTAPQEVITKRAQRTGDGSRTKVA